VSGDGSQGVSGDGSQGVGSSSRIECQSFNFWMLRMIDNDGEGDEVHQSAGRYQAGRMDGGWWITGRGSVCEIQGGATVSGGMSGDISSVGDVIVGDSVGQSDDGDDNPIGPGLIATVLGEEETNYVCVGDCNMSDYDWEEGEAVTTGLPGPVLPSRTEGHREEEGG
jgi:hypothetical protein